MAKLLLLDSKLCFISKFPYIYNLGLNQFSSDLDLFPSQTKKHAVEKELDHLEAEGIFEKVDSSEWAVPIVLILKGMAFCNFVVATELQ